MMSLGAWQRNLFILLLLLVHVWTPPAQSFRWLALGQSSMLFNVSSHCAKARKLHELTASQTKLCRNYLRLMKYIKDASKIAIAECQNTFLDRRWNCSTINLAPNFAPDLTSGTREQAFVSALSAATLGHTVARACSGGQLPDCGCGSLPVEPPDGSFKWGGCGDDVRYGLWFSRTFADAPWRGRRHRRTLKATLHRHNHHAGRQAVEYSLQKQCKCHGVSGACNVKTCWRALPQMGEISARLKRKYSVASEVVDRPVAPSASRPRHHHLLLPSAPHLGPLRDDDLVYVTKSPDYCTWDPRVGSLGTSGRECNASSDGHDGCDSMCCGRGYESRTVEKIELCHCKYYWCCYVKCKMCKSLLKIHHCH